MGNEKALLFKLREGVTEEEVQEMIERVKAMPVGSIMVAAPPLVREIPPYTEDWEDKGWPEWKHLLVDDAGNWNEEAIKNEFHDYARMIEHVPTVYCHITRDFFSYPTYAAELITSKADEVQEDLFWKWYREKVAPVVTLLELVQSLATGSFEEGYAVAFSLSGHQKYALDSFVQRTQGEKR